MGMGNMDFSQMLNNPALMNMVITFIQHTKLHQELVKWLQWTSYNSHILLSLDEWAFKLEIVFWFSCTKTISGPVNDAEP